MFESTTPGQTQGTVHVAAVAKVAREARWSLDSPRSYLVPSLFWFASGHGRIQIDGALRGFTTCNALFIPANTPHAIEIAPRTQGIAVFFNAASGLACPETVVHLRLYGLGRQSELTRMIDEISKEAAAGAADSDIVLFHQSALLMHWLKRRDGTAVPAARAPRASVTDTRRANERPRGS
ncbi:MAG: hypothetical protein NXH97_06745 [Rhodobacteraceae bacterium]|nr:hypothetical protein [Paracoccaceae bacterium]